VNIAIIGTGNVGSALASSLSSTGERVTLAARDERKTADTAARLGLAAATPRDAAAGADLVVLAVPGDALAAVAADLGDEVRGKIVVDVTNQMNPDLTAASNAERLQELLPDAPVVKAFNTAFASIQADPRRPGFPADGYVAADDAAAKQMVLELVKSIGFRPVDAGALSAARMLEGMAWLNISRNLAGGSWQTAWAIVEPRA
jgi:predicted dinucleotide-binding enzyme